MKFPLLTVLLCLTASLTFSQNKTTANYYSYLRETYKGMKGKTFTRNWLRDDDVKPIIIEELTKAGYDSLDNNTVLKSDNGEEFHLMVYSLSSNIGFYYIDGHAANPEKGHRDILFLNQKGKADYKKYKGSALDEYDFKTASQLPENIFILKEDCYFFEYSDNSEDNKSLVSKIDAIEILRQDIRNYIAFAKKKTSIRRN